MLMKVPAFQARQGEGGQLVMSVLSCFQLGKGHSHQAHLDMESQLGLRAGLAVAQTRKLFGLTEQACNLEARFVIAIEACRGEIDVGAQERSTERFVQVSTTMTTRTWRLHGAWVSTWV
jgi:hypothetical protein